MQALLLAKPGALSSVPAELKPHATVDEESVRGCPDVHRPPPIGCLPREKERIMGGLPHAQDVFRVHEQPDIARNTLAQHAEFDVGTALAAVGIVVE